MGFERLCNGGSRQKNQTMIPIFSKSVIKEISDITGKKYGEKDTWI